MDHYFKRKNCSIGNDEPIIIDESNFSTENSNMEHIDSNTSNSNEDDSLIIIEENKTNISLNRKIDERVKSDLKQLLSGRSNTESSLNKRTLAISDKNNKSISKRSKTSSPAVTKKTVEVIEKSKTENKSDKNLVRKLLVGNTSKETRQSADKFFSENKLNRFHDWSSKKNINNPYFPEHLYVNDKKENLKEHVSCIEDFYPKRNIEHDNINYNVQGFISEFMNNPKDENLTNIVRTLDVPGKSKAKSIFKDDTELWTESLKPMSYDELKYLIPLETLQTLRYQFEVSLNFLKTRPDHERQLLEPNWKSIMKKRKILNENENYEDLDSYDNDFIVDDELIDEDGNEIALDHVPLFILYGNGIGKNTTLQLLLQEMEKCGYNVNNILEINTSMNRGKKDIFNVCFEACTSKFLSKEHSFDNDQNKKSHLSGGVILFDEVDILFRSDVLFYPMIIKLLQVTKKPIILTCSSLENIPEQFVKITDYQKTNFMFNMPDTIIPYLNLKLGLNLKPENLDKYSNINKDIRHSLLQLQLDRKIYIEQKTKLIDENSIYSGLKSQCESLSEFSENIDLMSLSDILEVGTKYKSNITKSCDYSVLDFIDNEIYNDLMNPTKIDLKFSESSVEDYDDLIKKEVKMRLNGTINLQNLRNVNKLLSSKRNYYEENLWNTLEEYELDIGKELKKIALTRDGNLNEIVKLLPSQAASNKSKLARNLYLKLEYMQSNTLTPKARLQPTRTTINEFLCNLETSKDSTLKNISFADMFNKNYILTDNRLNYEFTKADDIFCYHYPYFRSLFAVDISNRQVIQSQLDSMKKEENVDNIQGLKYLIKEKKIKQLIFDQDPRIYWEQ